MSNVKFINIKLVITFGNKEKIPFISRYKDKIVHIYHLKLYHSSFTYVFLFTKFTTSDIYH